MNELLDAVLAQDIATVNRLLPTASDDEINVALLTACTIGFTNIVIALFESPHAKVNAFDNHKGWTNLIRATISDTLEVVQFLIDKGADINRRDKVGMTPLGYANINKLISISDYLKSKGAKD